MDWNALKAKGWNNMQKLNRRLQGIFGFVGFLVMILLMYFLLLGPDKTVFSISTWDHFIRHLPYQEGVVVLCILPLYFAGMIFGGGALGWYLASRLAFHVAHPK